MKYFIDHFLDKVLAILIIFGITILIDHIIDVILDKTIKLRNKKKITTFLSFIKKIKKAILYILAFLVSLSLFDIFNSFSMTLLSGLGIGSVVVGLAAQESLKNFFASISIVIGSPFEVGDFIECTEKNVSGTVEDITMRQTVIRTINNRRVVIPNSVMNTLVIENFCYSDNELVKTVDYEIAYEADIERAMNIIREEMQKVYVLNPKGPNRNDEYPKVRVSGWADSGINIRAWIWGKDNANVFENMYKLNYEIKKRFDEEGIEIPYPHVQLVKNK